MILLKKHRTVYVIIVIIGSGQLENQRRGSNGLREIPYIVVHIYIEQIISSYRGNASTVYVIV